MNNAVITVENLTKRYRNAGTPAVDNISFSVGKGEFFAFPGQNGAGKTTTISILTTTLAKTTGNVTVAGYDLSREAREVRSRIGIIFQKPGIDLDLSAEENIRLHACLYGLYAYRPFFRWMPKAYRGRVTELAEIMGIAGELRKPLKTFSGGMRRKIEIIRSLIHRPAVLFLDEPTQGQRLCRVCNVFLYYRRRLLHRRTAECSAIPHDTCVLPAYVPCGGFSGACLYWPYSKALHGGCGYYDAGDDTDLFIRRVNSGESFHRPFGGSEPRAADDLLR